MALEFPIKLEGVEDGVAILSMPADSPTSVVIPDYDLDADLALAELGFEPTLAAALALEWRSGMVRFLASRDNLEGFLEAIGNGGLKKGMKKLGLDKKSFGSIISQVAWLAYKQDASAIRGLIERDEFFDVVFEQLGTEAQSLEWDSDVIWEYAQLAYDDGAYELFVMLESLTLDTLAEFHTGSAQCKRIDDTSYRCSIDMHVDVLNEQPVRHWTLIGTAAFKDAELETWGYEVNLDSEDPEEVEELLEAMGADTGWEGVLEYETAADVEEPCLPPTDDSGNYAVFINGDLLQRYGDMFDAQNFVGMSEETIEREGLGDEVEAYELSADVDPEDDDFDEDDLENWEKV